MPSSIYYPRTVTTSKEIVRNTCPKDMTSEEFERMFLSANGPPSGNQRIFPPNKPVVVPSSGQGGSACMAPLKACTAEEQKTLSHMSHYAGGAATMGLASLLSDTKILDIVGDLNTFGGNGMGAAVAQSSRVLGAINEYDLANKRYEDLKNHRAAPGTLNTARTQRDLASKTMNQVLNEKSLNYLNNNTVGMRQTTTVTGKTVWESIPVRNLADVEKLANLAKYGRVAGPGLIALDGYFRASSVHQSWKNNDPNWTTRLTERGGSFGIGIGVGMVVGTVIALTPVGLVVGVVVAGGVAVGADHLVKDRVGRMYDRW